MIFTFDKAEADSTFVEDGQEYVMMGGICLPNHSDTIFECEIRTGKNRYLQDSVFSWLENKDVEFYVEAYT